MPRVANCALILKLAALAPYVASAQVPPPAPPVFQDLYTSLNTYLTTFNATLNVGKGAPSSVMYALDLKNANGNAGPQLVNPGSFAGIELQLQELQAMGAKGIMVEIGFPILYEPFLTSQGQSYSQFVSFYQQVAAAIRSAGMQLIIENDTLLSNDVQAGWNVAPFYAGLDWTQYQQARAQTALTIAQTLRPDYLVVLEEPDTEALNTGQSQVDSPSGATALVSQILASVQKSGVPNLKVGAGLGTWLNGAMGFIQDFVTLPLDFIDMHVYPVNFGYLPLTLQIATTAAAAGKPVSMTECWMWKVRDNEFSFLSADQIRARDPFSFWSPLDAYFLQVMRNLADSTQMLFMAPMGTQYFAAYLNYDPSTENLTPSEILSQESAQASQNLNAAIYTNTATSYYGMLVAPVDKIPPVVPGDLAGGSANPSTTYVNWNASTDNIGVAGYNVLRNDAVVGTTANQYFQDSGLSEATTYSYSVVAFDLAGNLSTASAPINLTTADVTPPSAPGNPTITALSSQKASLAWSPSTDNGSLRDYLVFWGISPAALVQSGRTLPTVTTYTSYPLTAGSTYYYGVEAVDNSGNTSAMSTIVAVTMPMPPSAPASLSASPASAAKVTITWPPSASGGLPIFYYQVLRGSSATSLTKIGTTAQTSYNDRSLAPGTTYYYAVQAVDTGGDVSSISPVAPVTTLLPPSAPAGLTATADSTSRISVVWSASVTGGLPILSYHVYRGTSASGLSQVAVVAQTTYQDKSVSPVTMYYYAVQAEDTGGDLSAMSPAIAATTPAPPATPTGLAAIPASIGRVNLTWSVAASGGLPIQSYHVYRGASVSDLSQVAVVAQPAYQDKSVSAGTSYYYAVTATDTGGDQSAMSTMVLATVPSPPSMPVNLVAAPLSTNMIQLTWSAAASGGLPIQGYHVFRGTSPTGLSQVASVAQTLYTDSSGEPSTTYYYGVEAVDSGGDVSPMSAVVSGTTLALPLAPTNLVGVAVSQVEVNLTWTAALSGLPLKSNSIYRGSSPANLTLLKVVGAAAVAFTDNQVTTGTTYYYGIEATDSHGDVSSMSVVVAVTTP